MVKLAGCLIFICTLFCFSCTNNPESYRVIQFNEGWQFTSTNYEKSYEAKVPGSVHTDLFNNKLIPDPFIGNVETDLQWIDSVEWIYIKTFNKPKGLLPTDQLELIFKGLDTYADVYLNDSLLFTANNMFLPWKSKIRQESLLEVNRLIIKFRPVIKEELQQYKKLNYELPGGPRIFTRKAAYQYGWDWAPKYISCGIWQNVEFHIWNKVRIQDINYKITDLDSTLAKINIQTTIESIDDILTTIDLKSIDENLNFQFKNVEIQKGIHNYNFEIEIQNPKLWWVRNLGNPFLYRFDVSLKSKNEIYDLKKINIGLRTIELIREPDKHGESFYFKLNGVPAFMKGANYVPQSSFPGAVTDDQYLQIIEDVKASNMNMLRVWGGGIYEKEIFYELCDEAGIMIWQDFMFANAMYPNDNELIENIKKETSYQVNRLSKHPSIAVWCGNNEMDEAWHNWGWSRSYSKKDSTEIWNNYVEIFHEILPKIVDSLNPLISYTSSSPLFGRGNPRSSFEGDNHYWYVWHDAYDFDWYNKVTGRFMSEFGFQSFPSIETIEYFDTSENKGKDSELMLAHQKHHKGNFLINHYMKDYFPVPENFEDFVYISQLLQAEGIRTGILAQRRAKPFCMGSLYWQLNDCWPAISWSGIDYNGNWKALHYFAKEDFKNIILNPYINKDTLEVFAISDSIVPVDLKLKIILMDFEGNSKSSEVLNFIMENDSSKKVYMKSISNLIGNNNPENHLIQLKLSNNKVILDTRNVYFTEPKNLVLPEYEMNIATNAISEGYEIRITSKKLIKNLYIHIPKKGKLSNNFFDLLPNYEMRILFKTQEKIDNLENLIKFKSLNQNQKK